MTRKSSLPPNSSSLPNSSPPSSSSSEASPASSSEPSPVSSTIEIINEERFFFQANQLNGHESELISEITHAMSIFPNENDLPVVGQLTDYTDVFSLVGHYTRQIVRFCKSLPAFRWLPEDDQILLLKPFHAEIVSIRTAFLFNPTVDGFNLITVREI